MAEFESWNQYQEFAAFVMRKARHVFDERSQRFLETVVETATKRKCTAEKGEFLWRAQRDNEWRTEPIPNDAGDVIDSFEVPVPSPPTRMVPKNDSANEGRVNPKGIPCFYLSTDRETAMAEVRPWIGSYVSVAQFETIKDLTLLDCSADSTSGSFLYLAGAEPGPDKREEAVWQHINRAFSRPVTRTDDLAEYAPTQVLAETFRAAGYEGVMYSSKLGIGKTVAFFDLGAAKLLSCHLYLVEAVHFKFSTAANPYFMDGKI